jgi:hypothetical protein
VVREKERGIRATRLSPECYLEFGRLYGAETVAGSRTQGSRPLKRTSPWVIVDRSSGAEDDGIWVDSRRGAILVTFLRKDGIVGN